ncbi:hypothetical protein PPO43_06685 [Saprospira sp. CCB-QB6]|uniref:hypothetical protein n=1 Tax=Saprospira sp. CCB-QB6 TaxID=3023936 RepID=UPI00234B9FF3|nr:hypothetical protein [Saprospira sp. CCB-QB6]WCL82776.1 hypothetical protein PPO43_06685 [Saprospira sp. CCB-QB6]
MLEAAVAVAAAFDLQQDLPAAALVQAFLLEAAVAVAAAFDLQQDLPAVAVALVQAALLVQAFLDLVQVFVVAVASALAALAAA